MTLSNTNLKKEINKIIWALKFNVIPIKNKKLKDKPVIVQKLKKRKKKRKIKTSDTNYKTNIDEKKLKLTKISEEKKDANSRKILKNNIDNSEIGININTKVNDKNNIIIKKILEKNDFELNSLDYEEVRKLDNRNYCEYYFSLMKNNHPKMFSFSFFNDYNSKIIKIFLFFFSFSLDLTVNALFFTDDTMHKIYQDKGKFNFLYQIPQILYIIFNLSILLIL